MPILTHDFCCRPLRDPMSGIPFGARSAGCYFATRPWRRHASQHWYLQIYWGVAGCGSFSLNDRRYLLEPGAVLAMYSGDLHHLEVVDEVWNYRWFTLDGPDAERLARSFGLSNEPRQVGECPAELFERLEKEVINVTPQGQRQAMLTGFELLSRCGGVAQPILAENEQFCEKIKLIIETHFCDPCFNVDALARQMKIHRSTISRIFHQHTDMTLIDYLTTHRIQKMLSMLVESSLSVREIAGQCGFSGSNYAIRMTKKRLGKTPREFRKSQ